MDKRGTSTLNTFDMNSFTKFDSKTGILKMSYVKKDIISKVFTRSLKLETSVVFNVLCPKLKTSQSVI